jgi:transcriptional regulator with XRE-family HTH domain
MSSENTSIGMRLKEIRAKTGLNQQDFAETIGASYRSYRGYESGEREVPTVPTALIEKSPEKAAAFLKLLVKLSLKQGEGLTQVDAQEIAQQSLKE